MSEQPTPWWRYQPATYDDPDYSADLQDDEYQQGYNYEAHSPAMHNVPHWQMPPDDVRWTDTTQLQHQTDPAHDQWVPSWSTQPRPFQYDNAALGGSQADQGAYNQDYCAPPPFPGTEYDRDGNIVDRGLDEPESNLDSTAMRVGSFPQSSPADQFAGRYNERPATPSTSKEPSEPHRNGSSKKPKDRKKKYEKDHKEEAKNRIKSFEDKFGKDGKGDKGGASSSGRRRQAK